MRLPSLVGWTVWERLPPTACSLPECHRGPQPVPSAATLLPSMPALRPTPRSPCCAAVLLHTCPRRLLPEHFLGLQQGDAEVIRNGGGRVTEDVIRSAPSYCCLAELWAAGGTEAGWRQAGGADWPRAAFVHLGEHPCLPYLQEHDCVPGRAAVQRRAGTSPAPQLGCCRHLDVAG